MARILIVEDYENLQNIYATVLTKEGHEVTVVNDGLVALDKTKDNKYDIILLDLLLPHMSGVQFMRAYEPKMHPETKILMCSNFTNPKYIVEAGQMGVDHYLTKSNVTPKEIADVISKMLKEPK